MATRNIVPRANNEGSVGTSGKKFAAVHAVTMFVNGQAVAPLASPAFSGNPTAPTQDPSDNSTRLATTAWVTGKLSGFVTSLAAGNADKIVVLQADGNFTYSASTVANVLDRTNHTGAQAISTITGLQDALDAKATGVAANFLARANHTGSQAISTITGLQDALNAKLTDTSGAFGLTMLATANQAAALSALGLDSSATPTFSALTLSDNAGFLSVKQIKGGSSGLILHNANGVAVLTLAAGGASALTAAFAGTLSVAGAVTLSSTLAVSGQITCTNLNPSDPATTRTNLGATAVGTALFTAASPGFVAYVRVNADNTVSLLSANDFKSALGYGTAASLNVASVGDAAVGEVVKGNDTRLTNARTPTSHTHVSTDLSDSTATGRALLTTVGASAARTTLQLGTVATLDTGTTNGTVPVIGTGNTLTLSTGGGSADCLNCTSAGVAVRGISTGGDAIVGEASTAIYSGVKGTNTAGIGVFGSSDSAVYEGVRGYNSTSGNAIRGESESGTGAEVISVAGTYHAKFGDTGDNRSFVARVLGAFGWWRGVYRGFIQAAATLTADRTWTLPDKTGTVCILDSYVDDTAAGVGGYTTGQIYLNTTTGKPTAKT